MPRCQKDPLRPLTGAEQHALVQLSRSQAAPAAEVTRATLLLAVAHGASYQQAARTAGRRSGDAVCHLVSRFNREGLAALRPRHAGGPRRAYGEKERDRGLAEAARTPTPERDGTASWSLAALREALRSAPDGLPAVSTFTLWQVLHEAGYAYQRTRSWCPTGQALRKRKAGDAAVTDPGAAPKKS